MILSLKLKLIKIKYKKPQLEHRAYTVANIQQPVVLRFHILDFFLFDFELVNV